MSLLMRLVMPPVNKETIHKAIFTSKTIYKSDEPVDAINNLTINDAGYALNKATASDTQDDPTINPDTVTHTRNRLDTVTHTSNRVLDQKILCV